MNYDLSGKPPAIEPGSLILVTGVTGFLGSYVADLFLKAEYNVRGTSRSAARAQWTADHFDKLYGLGRYEIVEVSDMGDVDRLKEAMKDVSGVAHVASDLSMGTDPENIITPVIRMTRAVLTAAASVPSIKRFVLTSSSTALTSPKPGQKIKITTDTWNEKAVKIAWSPPSPDDPARGSTVYGASKTQGEQEAWKFVSETHPHFVFNAVLPNAIFGPILDKSQYSTCSNWVWSIADTGSLETARKAKPQWFVDVDDVARLHLAAMIDPTVGNERILGFSEPFNWTQVVSILKHLYPGKKWPDGDPDEPHDLMDIPNGRAVELLRKFGLSGFIPLEESLKKMQDQKFSSS